VERETLYIGLGMKVRIEIHREVLSKEITERRECDTGKEGMIIHSLATQSLLRDASSIELSVVQKTRSVALRPVQLFWSRSIIAYERN